jgi:hypothetical protein
MNTTITPTNNTPVQTEGSDELATSGRPTSKRRGLIRLLALGLAALSIGTAAGALPSAQPVAAASSVGYCFKTRTGMIVAPATTYLQLYYNGRWNNVAVGSTSFQNGCGSFNMSGSYRNYYSKVVLSFRDARSGNTFYGETPMYAYPGSLAVHLGTGTLRCYGGPCYGA